MGFDNQYALPVVVDIETVARSTAEINYLLGPPKAPANYKRPETIEQAKLDKRVDEIATAALDIDLCRVVAIGIAAPWTVEPYKPYALLVREPGLEPSMITALWNGVTLGRDGIRPMITFNGIGYDLRVLRRRCQIFGIRAPKLNLDRYRSPHTDLMLELCDRDLKQARGLQFYVRLFELADPTRPYHDVTGADIARLVAEDTDEAWAQIEGHVVNDITDTLALARRLGFIAPAPPTLSTVVPETPTELPL